MFSPKVKKSNIEAIMMLSEKTIKMLEDAPKVSDVEYKEYLMKLMEDD